MPAPWEMTYGPYWEQEQRRRESSRRALGMPAISPSQVAAETYGMEQARLGEKRAFTQQFINNYFRNQEIERAKSAASQQQTTEAVKGVGSLALGGYKLGKEAGLWGVDKGVSTVNNVAGQAPSSAAETGLTTAGQAMPESIPGGAMQAIPEVSAIPEVVPGALQATSGAGELAMALPGTTEGILGASEVAGAALGAETAAIAGAGAITEAALPAIPVVAGVVEGAMGTGVAATAAATAATAETGVFASILPSLSVLGPIGWGLGLVGGIASVLLGDEISKLFK